LYQIFWFVFIIKCPAYWLCQNTVYRLCSDLIWWLLNWYLWRWSDYIGNNSYVCSTEWYQSVVVILIRQLQLWSYLWIIWNAANENCGWILWIQRCVKSLILSILVMIWIIMMVCISYDLVCYWWHSWNLLIEIWFDFQNNWKNRAFLFCIDCISTLSRLYDFHFYLI